MEKDPDVFRKLTGELQSRRDTSAAKAVDEHRYRCEIRPSLGHYRYLERFFVMHRDHIVSHALVDSPALPESLGPIYMIGHEGADKLPAKNIYGLDVGIDEAIHQLIVQDGNKFPLRVLHVLRRLDADAAGIEGHPSAGAPPTHRGPNLEIGVKKYVDVRDFICQYVPHVDDLQPIKSPLSGENSAGDTDRAQAFSESDSVSSSMSVNKAAEVADAARLQMLDEAVSGRNLYVDPLQAMAERVREATIQVLGGEALLGRPIRNEVDLVELLAVGFPGEVLRKLQDAGCPHSALEQVIAPRRTLMRRRSLGQRLTSEESDASWRLAHALTLAETVLNGRAAAINWLIRPKDEIGRAPVELLKTSVGAAYVERKLWQLEWGDVA